MSWHLCYSILKAIDFCCTFSFLMYYCKPGLCSKSMQFCATLFPSVTHSVVSSCLWPHGVTPLSAPLSMGFSRQEYWIGWPFPPPGNLLNPELNTNLPYYRQILYCLTLREDSEACTKASNSASQSSLLHPLTSTLLFILLGTSFLPFILKCASSQKATLICFLFPILRDHIII